MFRFGPAGVPNSTKKRSTEEGIKTVKKLGLDAMEVQFVRGVKMGEERAKNVKKVSELTGVALSVHAPYYINLNSSDKKKREESIQRIIDSVRIGSLMCARNIVFHAGYYLKSSKENTYRRIKEGIEICVGYMVENGLDIYLRPETTGKPSQFGELEEVLRLSSEIDFVLPCIDFSHIHARTRSFNRYEQFLEILQKIENILGGKAIKDMHIHLSGIKYGMKGERSHLNLKESDMKFRDLLKALRDFNAKGTIICESPNLEEDAIMLKKLYEELK
jgi:deoxyribonuclease-4